MYNQLPDHEKNYFIDSDLDKINKLKQLIKVLKERKNIIKEIYKKGAYRSESSYYEDLMNIEEKLRQTKKSIRNIQRGYETSCLQCCVS